MYCNFCGKEIPDGSAFCEYCKSPANSANTSSETYKLTLFREHQTIVINSPIKVIIDNSTIFFLNPGDLSFSRRALIALISRL